MALDVVHRQSPITTNGGVESVPTNGTAAEKLLGLVRSRRLWAGQSTADGGERMGHGGMEGVRADGRAAGLGGGPSQKHPQRQRQQQQRQRQQRQQTNETGKGGARSLDVGAEIDARRKAPRAGPRTSGVDVDDLLEEGPRFPGGKPFKIKTNSISAAASEVDNGGTVREKENNIRGVDVDGFMEGPRFNGEDPSWRDVNASEGIGHDDNGGDENSLGDRGWGSSSREIDDDSNNVDNAKVEGGGKGREKETLSAGGINAAAADNNDVEKGKEGEAPGVAVPKDKGARAQDVRGKNAKAEARAKRRATRESLKKSGASVEVPRMLGCGDESARFFGGDRSARNINDCADGDGAGVEGAKDESGVQEETNHDAAGGLAHDASSEDAKAEARAKRRATRESLKKSGASVEAPRVLGYGDESARFFGGDPSTRSTNDSADCDYCDAGRAKDQSGVQEEKNRGATEGRAHDVSSKDAKAEARAKRRATRESLKKSGASVEAPRVLGYGDESARFFGGDPSTRSINDSVNGADADVGGAKDEPGAQEEKSHDTAGIRGHYVSSKDTKAEARANRRATRESLKKSGASVEVPRMLGCGDESVRSFGGDPSARNINDCADGADAGVEGAKDESGAQEETSHDAAGLRAHDVSSKDAKAEARAKRRAMRESLQKLGASVEAPLVMWYGDESERFFGCNSSTRNVLDSTNGDGAIGEGVKGETFSSTQFEEVNDGSKDLNREETGGPFAFDPPDWKMPQRINNSLQGERETKIDNERGASELSIRIHSIRCNPTLPANSGGMHNNNENHLENIDHSGRSAGDQSLHLSDLRHSAGSSFQKQSSMQSILSELSLKSVGEDSVDEDYNMSSRSSLPAVSKRVLGRREDNGLRRSSSEGVNDPDLKPMRSPSLRSRALESKKRQRAHRMKRTRVARMGDGKLDSSMNSSMVSSKLASSIISSSSGGVLGHFRDQIPFRRATAGNAVSSPTASQDGEPLRRASTGSVRHPPRKDRNDGRNWGRHFPIMGGDAISFLGGSQNDIDKDSESGAPLDRSGSSRRSSVPQPFVMPSMFEEINEDDEEEREKQNEPSPPEEEVEGEEELEHHSQRHQKSVLSMGLWTPFRRYMRRTSSNIMMLENQFFIPPPEEGTRFFEALSFTWSGYGNDFVIWIYQASFFTVLAMFFVAYYAVIFAFAGLLVAIETNSGGRCGLSTYEVWSKSDSIYELGFELAWTTFTTVGYGVIAPSGDDYQCYPIRFACSLFAFMGLLFNAVSAAIFFSKLERVFTSASVTFSSSLCLQFGEASGYTRGSKGVYGQFWMKNNSMRSLASIETDKSSASIGSGSSGRGPPNSLKVIRELSSARRTAPYPFIEFRIVNDHANYKTRAIRSAHATAMVQISAQDADNLAKDGFKHETSTAMFREEIAVAPKDKDEDHHSSFERPALPRVKSQRRNAHLSESIVATALVVQESDLSADEGGGPEGRVYYPLNLEPSDHPYLRRVWYIRHTLDARSPLLKQSVRDKIKRDGGWDLQKCKYQDMLASLVDFYRIRVTFKGISAVSNALVFAQKVYDIEDVYVGYQFGQIFYEKERWMWFRRLLRLSPKKAKQEERGDDNIDDDNLMLDKRLIHDILPQLGGGQEPIEG